MVVKSTVPAPFVEVITNLLSTNNPSLSAAWESQQHQLDSFYQRIRAGRASKGEISTSITNIRKSHQYCDQIYQSVRGNLKRTLPEGIRNIYLGNHIRILEEAIPHLEKELGKFDRWEFFRRGLLCFTVAAVSVVAALAFKKFTY